MSDPSNDHGFLSRARELATSPRREDRYRRRVIRRLAAGACLGTAVVSGLGQVRAAQAEVRGVATVVAARDVPAGTVLGPDDLRVESRPAGSRSARATGDPASLVGRRTSSFVAARVRHAGRD